MVPNFLNNCRKNGLKLKVFLDARFLWLLANGQVFLVTPKYLFEAHDKFAGPYIPSKYIYLFFLQGSRITQKVFP